MKHISYIITSKLITKMLNPATGTGKAHPSLESKDQQLKSGTSKDGGCPQYPHPMSHCHMTCNLCMGVCMSLAYSSEVEVLIGDNIDYIMKKFASEISN